jgi:hypothetical protein
MYIRIKKSKFASISKIIAVIIFSFDSMPLRNLKFKEINLLVEIN